MTIDETLQIDLAEAMDHASELNVRAEPLSYDERRVLLLRDEVRRLRAKLARVEALPADFRNNGDVTVLGLIPACIWRVAAEYLEEALKEEP